MITVFPQPKAPGIEQVPAAQNTRREKDRRISQQVKQREMGGAAEKRAPKRVTPHRADNSDTITVGIFAQRLNDSILTETKGTGDGASPWSKGYQEGKRTAEC